MWRGQGTDLTKLAVVQRVDNITFSWRDVEIGICYAVVQYLLRYELVIFSFVPSFFLTQDQVHWPHWVNWPHWPQARVHWPHWEMRIVGTQTLIKVLNYIDFCFPSPKHQKSTVPGAPEFPRERTAQKAWRKGLEGLPWAGGGRGGLAWMAGTRVSCYGLVQ